MKVTLFSALAALSPLAVLAAPIAARQANTTASANTTISSTDGPVGYASQNGGTTGGAGGSSITVTSISELAAAVKGDSPTIVYISGTLSGSTDKIRVGSNKSILGKDASSKLVGAGLFIKEAKNVIVQNLAISKVSEDGGDAIGVQKSENVWIDHCDLSSDVEHGKDFYDGLCDFSHGSDFLTVR
jgi:pectate lyase